SSIRRERGIANAIRRSWNASSRSTSSAAASSRITSSSCRRCRERKPAARPDVSGPLVPPPNLQSSAQRENPRVQSASGGERSVAAVNPQDSAMRGAQGAAPIRENPQSPRRSRPIRRTEAGAGGPNPQQDRNPPALRSRKGEGGQSEIRHRTTVVIERSAMLPRSLPLLAPVLLAAVLIAPARAGDATVGDVLWQIRREGTERSQVMQTLHVLTDVYGPRLTGSPNLKAAGEWARQQLEAWGLV